MKNKILLILCLILVVLVTGCGRKDKYKVIECTRNVESTDEMSTDFKYKIYYEDKYIMRLESTEEITTENKELLNQYKTAYQNVYKAYEGIDYYNHTLEVDNHTLTSKVDIDYSKVDIDKIIDIEGNDDKLYNDDGKFLLKKALSFYKKAGVQCDD